MTNLGRDSGPNYLWKTLLTQATNGLEKFLQIGIGVLDKLVPLKKKYDRGNNISFMNKPLARAHMKRTRWRSRFLKNRFEVSRNNFTKQRNYCVSLSKNNTKKQ